MLQIFITQDGWYYEDQLMEHDDFDEPDMDSDFDYEESKKKKKKAMAKSTPKVCKSSFNIQFALLHDAFV